MSYTVSRRNLLKLGGAGLVGAGLGSTALTRAAFGQSFTLRGAAPSSQQGPIDALAEKFKARYPGSDISFEYAASDPLTQSVRVQLTSGTAPDILPTWPGGGNALSVGQVAPNGFLRGLNDRSWSTSVPKAFDDVTRLDGELYFLSMQVSMIGAIVNMDVWPKFGVEQPKTWSAFLDVCQKIKDQGVTPIAMGAGDAWTAQLTTYALVASTEFGKNPDFADEMLAGNATFSESGWKEALEKYMELNNRGFLSANPVGTSNAEQLQMLVSGEAAMMIMVSNQMGQLFTLSGHNNFWQFPVPGTDDPSQTRIPASASSGFGVNAAGNVDAALAWVDFLAEPENVAAWGEVSGLPTVLPGRSNRFDGIYKDMKPLLDSDLSVLYMDNKWPNSRVQQTHMSGVQELLNDANSIEAVLKAMDDAFVSS